MRGNTYLRIPNDTARTLTNNALLLVTLSSLAACGPSQEGGKSTSGAGGRSLDAGGPNGTTVDDAGGAAEDGASGASTAPQESPDCTILSSTTGSIRDAKGNIWTLVQSSTNGLEAYENGIYSNGTMSVTELLYANHVVSQENVKSDWWSWTNNAWVSETNPASACSSDAGGSTSDGGTSSIYSVPPGPLAGDINITSSPYDCSTSSSDNSSCINNAINAAKAGGVGVYVPPGSFNYAKLLVNPGVRIDGAGYSLSTLNAETTNASDMQLTGNGAIVANMTFTATGVSPTRQNDSTIASAISPQPGVSGWQVDHVLINGHFTAGVFSFGGSNGKVTNSTIENTLADCIGFYWGASNNLADSNYIYNCGDDGISNVTYPGDPGYVSYNTISNNVVMNNSWGRGETVMGGQNITFSNNLIWNNQVGLPCLAFGDGSTTTLGGTNIIWTGGELGGNCTTYYPGGLFIGSSLQGDISNVTMTNFTAKFSGGVGINVNQSGGGTVSNVNLENYVETEEGSDKITSGAVTINTTCSSHCTTYVPSPVGAEGQIFPPQ